MDRNLILLALFVVALAPSASALEYSDEYCLNSTVRYWESNIYNQSSGDVLLSLNETEICSYGCSIGKCIPIQDENSDISVIIGIGIMAFFFLYGAFKFEKGHAPLQILFLFSAVITIILEIGALGDIAGQSGLNIVSTATERGYQLATWVLIIMIFYFIIWFIYELLIKFGKIQPIRLGGSGGN